MAAIIVLIAFLAVLGLAAAFGFTADSRDTEYGLGLVLRRTRMPATPNINATPWRHRRGQFSPGGRRLAGNLPDVSPRSSVDRASAF